LAVDFHIHGLTHADEEWQHARILRRFAMSLKGRDKSDLVRPRMRRQGFAVALFFFAVV
jgi:hypothetical protein